MESKILASYVKRADTSLHHISNTYPQNC